MTQAIAALAAIDPLRETGQLDEADMVHFNEAENMLAGHGGREVARAFLHWRRNGQIVLDPRPRVLQVLGEKPPPRNHRPILARGGV